MSRKSIATDECFEWTAKNNVESLKQRVYNLPAPSKICDQLFLHFEAKVCFHFTSRLPTRELEKQQSAKRFANKNERVVCRNSASPRVDFRQSRQDRSPILKAPQWSCIISYGEILHGIPVAATFVVRYAITRSSYFTCYILTLLARIRSNQMHSVLNILCPPTQAIRQSQPLFSGLSPAHFHALFQNTVLLMLSQFVLYSWDIKQRTVPMVPSIGGRSMVTMPSGSKTPSTLQISTD